MSPVTVAHGSEEPAPLFAALGDAARLQLVARLSREGPQSISVLAKDAMISRQAVTKHLQVLEKAGLAASRREGRERIFDLRPERLAAVHRYLDQIGRQWDEALARLQAHVEKEKGSEEP
jgi:DNA-binding transcriptional ArsR family regulator